MDAQPAIRKSPQGLAILPDAPHGSVIENLAAEMILDGFPAIWVDRLEIEWYCRIKGSFETVIWSSRSPKSVGVDVQDDILAADERRCIHVKRGIARAPA